MNKRKLLQTAGGIFIILLVSRVIGFFREMLIAYRFGSGMETDAFFVASGVQGTILALFASGLTVAMIPIIAEIRLEGRTIDENRYVSSILNSFGLISIVMILLGYIFAEQIVRVFAIGFEGEQLRLAVLLTRISLPTVFFFMASSVLISYNHSVGKFIIPSMESIVFNVPILIYLLFYYKSYGIVGLMASIVLGSLLRVVVAYIPLARIWKYSFALSTEKESIKKTFVIMGPILIASLVGQVNHIVDKTLASRLTAGSISALAYAQRAKGVVVSLFLASVVTVIYPKLSEYISENKHDKLQKTMTYSMDLILLMVVPALTGLVVLSYPIIKVLFYRGAFTENNVAMTSSALFFYSLGLLGAGVSLLVDKVYFALHDSKTPMKIGMVAVALNIALNLILVGPMKHNGLALATSITGTFAATVKFVGLKRKNIAVEYRKMFSTFIKASISSAVMGFAVYMLGLKFVDIPSGEATWQFVKLACVCVTGAFVYGVMTYVLKVDEVREIIHKVLNID